MRVYRAIVKLVPRSLVYRCLIRAWAFATAGKYEGVDHTKITMAEVIGHWEDR